jgi:arylsulfatase A-like enzyme
MHCDEPFFMHISDIRPHPPRRNPAGYHDLYSEEQVGPFTGFASPAAEAAFHPLNSLLVGFPLTAAPQDERERRQLRATYYGAQKEVDDNLGQLFGFLDSEGLSSETLVVLTSDHGEMGGDHWLIEKCGYWDESFHIPLVVKDPTAGADATRGLVVNEPTESVDVAATVLDWLGLEIPVQVDGWPLTSFLQDGVAPAHWRQAAHWEWDFRFRQFRLAEQLGIPAEHSSLAVIRTDEAKYVQFAADADKMPPLLFDLKAGPGELANQAANSEMGLALAQNMLRWRMRNLERSLTGCHLTPGVGPVWAQGEWR